MVQASVPGPERLVPSEATGREALPAALWLMVPLQSPAPGWLAELHLGHGLMGCVSAQAHEPGALRIPSTAFIVFLGVCQAGGSQSVELPPTSQLRQILILQGGSCQLFGPLGSCVMPGSSQYLCAAPSV